MADKKSDDTEVAEFTTNLHNIFHTDESLEEAGAWVTINDALGIKVQIRRLRSDAVIKAFERILRETYADAEEIARNPAGMSDEQSNFILKRQIAEAVIVDWVGVRDTKSGKEIPYSQQAALQLVGMKDFREFIYNAANSRDTFREKADKEAAGNS